MQKRSVGAAPESGLLLLSASRALPPLCASARAHSVLAPQAITLRTSLSAAIILLRERLKLPYRLMLLRTWTRATHAAGGALPTSSIVYPLQNVAPSSRYCGQIQSPSYVSTQNAVAQASELRARLERRHSHERRWHAHPRRN